VAVLAAAGHVSAPPAAPVSVAPEPQGMHAGLLETSSWFAKPLLHTQAVKAALDSEWAPQMPGHALVCEPASE
jgi:hypothetical protein